jgi:hypothetical protein
VVVRQIQIHEVGQAPKRLRAEHYPTPRQHCAAPNGVACRLSRTRALWADSKVWDGVGPVPLQVWDGVGPVPLQMWDGVGLFLLQMWQG